MELELPTPQNWQDFERLSLDVFKLEWKDDYAQRHGRQGQAQAGVDIFGLDRRRGEYAGVQCKKRKGNLYSDSETPANTLSTKEIDEEIKKAMEFNPSLQIFILATTANRD